MNQEPGRQTSRNQSEQQKEKEIKKNSLRDLWDNIKQKSPTPEPPTCTGPWPVRNPVT